MIEELDNPFSVTKATEFSDSQINEYWVNFNPEKGRSLDSILNPKEYMPKYIIGGKGCGKTHILRYYSYPLQKIRHSDSIYSLLSEDKYIGLYSVFHGLNSSRFSGKGIDSEEWQSIFEYYFELYVCDDLLHTLEDITKKLNIKKEVENEIIKKILSEFINYANIEIDLTFAGLINYLKILRRKIDSQVLNAAFTRKLLFEDIKVLFSPCSLLFGIPYIFSTKISELKDVKFIFIFDEFEKLFEWQKEFINGLVWDKKTPVTFWIGARRYGYTTRKTKTGQEMKAGSEFQDINLDYLIRDNNQIYKEFAVKLCENRLSKYYLGKNIPIPPVEINRKFFDQFEKYDDSKIIDELIIRNTGKEYPHIKDLRKKLAMGIKNRQALDLTEESQINFVIDSIKAETDNNPLEQKFKIFLLYQKWYKSSKKTLFTDIITHINSEYSAYKKGEKSEFSDIKDKRKKDLLAQLTYENKIKNTEYSGIDNFIELSQGNVRSFILTLKKAIEYARIRGERPLEEGGKVSLESQYFAVYDTARWFYEDAELIGDNGLEVYKSLKKLADYFFQERFCDKPTETTVSSFYLKVDNLSVRALNCIETMKMHSILIENIEGRKEKNSGIKERQFQINKTLAPFWNLPTVVRGIPHLPTEISEAIFNPEADQSFESLYKKRGSQLNAPDFVKYKISSASSLFSE